MIYREVAQSRFLSEVLCLLFLAAPLPHSALQAGDDFAAPRKMLEEGSMDGPAIAAAIKDAFMSRKEWEKEVEQFWSRFKDWETDTGGNLGNYLNDRMLIYGLSAVGGKTEKVKKALAWLAMYKEFDEEQPSYVARFLRDNRDSLIGLFAGFSWDKASLYIRNRQWRKDAEDRKRLATAGKP